MKSVEIFSPKKIAQAIGVSESSLKRWCDRGLLNFTRTAGGHRRIERADAVNFIRNSQLRLEKPSAIGLPELVEQSIGSVEEAHRRLVNALIGLDEAETRKLLLTLFIAGWSLHQIFDQVVTAAFHTIGQQWAAHELEVYRERHACEIAGVVIRELKSLLPAPAEDAPFAIGGSLQSDFYTLPTLMASVVLHSLGFRALSLGNNIPVSSMAAAAKNHLPDLFWISVSHVPDVSRIIADLQILKSTLPPETLFVVGGQALNDEIRNSLSGTVFCDNIRQLESFATNISSLIQKPSPPSP